MNSHLFKLVYVALLTFVCATNSWAEVSVIVHPSISDSASKKDISRIWFILLFKKKVIIEKKINRNANRK